MSKEAINTKMIRDKYKLNFLIILSLLLIASSIVSGVVFYNFVSYDLGGSYTNTRFAIKSVDDFLIPSLWFSITIFTLLLALGAIVISIFVSHKIAGPIYRLEQTFADYKDSFFYKITLRPKDQVKGLAKQLNYFVGSLISSLSSAKEITDNLGPKIKSGKLSASESEVDYEKISGIVGSLKDETKKLEQIMEFYKTD